MPGKGPIQVLGASDPLSRLILVRTDCVLWAKQTAMLERQCFVHAMTSVRRLLLSRGDAGTLARLADVT